MGISSGLKRLTLIRFINRSNYRFNLYDSRIGARKPVRFPGRKVSEDIKKRACHADTSSLPFNSNESDQWISMTLLTLAFSSGVRFGKSIVKTPSVTFALILSFSTSSGNTNDCWNFA